MDFTCYYYPLVSYILESHYCRVLRSTQYYSKYLPQFWECQELPPTNSGMKTEVVTTLFTSINTSSGETFYLNPSGQYCLSFRAGGPQRTSGSPKYPSDSFHQGPLTLHFVACTATKKVNVTLIKTQEIYISSFHGGILTCKKLKNN